ncbi:hypothetical protein MIR68_007763 [Amoeboaphelidium protococcarum]|nr:hypothetical protein MIR68_007763 [Amoeboaphelidium protococcarum]
MSQSDKDVLERMKQGRYTIKAMSDAVGVTVHAVKKYFYRKKMNENVANINDTIKRKPLDRMVTLAQRIVTRSTRTSIRNIRSKIGDQLNIQSPPISTSSIYCGLLNEEMVRRKLQNKPLVSKVNQHRRVSWCTLIKEKLQQDPEFLSRIIVSDEVTVRQFDVGKKAYEWQHTSVNTLDSNYNSRKQQGGISVMFFGATSKDGFGSLVSLEGSQNAETDKKTVYHHVIAYLQELEMNSGRSYIF